MKVNGWCNRLGLFLFLATLTLVSSWSRSTLFLNSRIRSICTSVALKEESNGIELISRRRDIVGLIVTSIVSKTLVTSFPVNAFDGGVGGLGKVKPKTGVVFRDSDTSPRLVTAAGGSDEILAYELVGPDGTIALVNFEAPWPLLQSPGQIEARDLQQPESAFVQVADLPKGATSAESLAASFYGEAVLGSEGKFGAYGAPFDVKIKRLKTNADGTTISLASFTTLTPSMRESPRKVCNNFWQHLKFECS